MSIREWVKENLTVGGNLDQAVWGAVTDAADWVSKPAPDIWEFLQDPMSGLREIEARPFAGVESALQDPIGYFRPGGGFDQAVAGDLGAVWDVITPPDQASINDVPEEARAVFDAANVNPYDEAGRYREASIRSAAESQNLGMKLAAQARDAAEWAALMSQTQRGSAARTVVDQTKLQMMQSAIDNALALGMQQLESQYQLMTDELNRQQELASDEIQRARLAALDSMTKMQDDLRQRGSQAQADIMQSIGRTQGGIAAATQEALSRLGSTDAVVSEGIRRSLEEEGQVERGLAASQGDIQADLAARLSQISQGALDRQRGLVETTAQGSSGELANLVAQITAQRASERSSAEFELSEDARQQALDLMLNPPTKKVGGRAKGLYADQAALIDIARRQGWDPGFTEIMAATGNLGDLLYAQNKPAELTTAMELAPYAQGMNPEDLMEASGTAIAEGRFDDALTLGELAVMVPGVS